MMTAIFRSAHYSCAFGAAVLLCHCASSPRDGQVIASRSTPVPFEIVVPWEHAVVHVEAARYRAGVFAYWDLEWGCDELNEPCFAEPLGDTDGEGSDAYWVVRHREVIPTTSFDDTSHWIPGGRGRPKWVTRIRAFAREAFTDPDDATPVATFANTTEASACIVNEFLEENGAAVYTECATGREGAAVFASAD
jgi:hypothetical protein